LFAAVIVERLSVYVHVYVRQTDWPKI